MATALEKLAVNELRLKSIYWFKVLLYAWLLLGNILIFPYREAFFSPSSLIHDYTKNYQDLELFTFIFQKPFSHHQMMFFYVQSLALIIGICNFAPLLTHLIIYVLTMNLWNKAWVTMDGGNNLLSILMLFMLFMNTSGKQLKVRKGIHGFIRPLIIVAHNVLFFACILQVITVYITAGYLKADGTLWQNGMALYYILQSDTYSTPIVGNLITRYPELSVIGSYFTQIFQLSFPTLVWFRRSRPFVFLAGFMLHIGIAVAMGLFLFGLAMIITYVLFLDDNDMAWLSQKSRSFRGYLPSIEWNSLSILAKKVGR